MPRKKSNSQKPTTSGEAVKMEADNAKLSLAKGHSELPSVNKEGEKGASSIPDEHLGSTKHEQGKTNLRGNMPANVDSQPSVCSKCKGLGYLTEKGIVHTCWDCLESGRLG